VSSEARQRRKKNDRYASADLSARAVVARLKRTCDVKTDEALARRLEVSKTTIAVWKKRNSVPYKACVKIAFEERTELDWLITGRPRKPYPGLFESNIDWEIIEICLTEIKAAGFLDDDERLPRTLRMSARFLALQYGRLSMMLSEAEKSEGLSREAVLNELRTSVRTELSEYVAKQR
jgi:hypothetical protein